MDKGFNIRCSILLDNDKHVYRKIDLSMALYISDDSTAKYTTVYSFNSENVYGIPNEIESDYNVEHFEYKDALNFFKDYLNVFKTILTEFVDDENTRSHHKIKELYLSVTEQEGKHESRYYLYEIKKLDKNIFSQETLNHLMSYENDEMSSNKYRMKKTYFKMTENLLDHFKIQFMIALPKMEE